MHQSFLNAISPKPRRRCLLVPLKPLTLGHLLLLRELRSEVFNPDGFGFADFLQAVFICAHWTAGEARAALKGGRAWAWILGRYWAWRCRKLKLNEEVQKFRDYFAAEREMPPIKRQDREESQSIAAPWEWVLKDFLMHAYGWPEKQAEDTPMLKAGVLWAVQMEAEQKIELGTSTNQSLLHLCWQLAHRERANN